MSFCPSKWALLILVSVWIFVPAEASAQRARFSVSSPVTIAAGDEAGLQAVAVGNLNNDDRPDIVVVSPDAEEGPLAVLINNGDGTYAAPRFIADDESTLSTPVAVAIADVGAVSGGPDGNNDILVADIDEGGFLVVFGDGAGNFTIEGEVTVVDGLDIPVGLAVADFDGQNGPDFAIIDEEGADNNGQVHFFCNEGTTGLFVPCPTPALDSGGEMPIDVGVGDFNGDENLDVLVLNQGPADTEDNGRLALFLGSGDGAFSIPSQATFPISRIARDLAIGSINPEEDSNDDAVVVDDDTFGLENASVFFGTTSGAILLRRSATLELGTTGVAIGSFAGSVAPDLAGTNDPNPRQERAEDASNIAVLLGNGTSSQPPFSETGALVGAQLGDVVTALAAGRLNDDALDDVVALTMPAEGEPQLIIALNTSASATETPGTPIGGTPTPTPTPTRPVATPELKGCSVALPVAPGPLSLALVKGDFDGDADTDLAVLDRDGSRVLVLLISPADLTRESTPSQPTCTIDAIRPIELGGRYASLAAGRLDGANADDLAVAGSSGVRALVSLGNGQFAAHQVATDATFASVAIGDFDSPQGGDVAAISGGNVMVFRGTTDGSTFTFTQVQSLPIVGAILLASGDFDGEGKTDDLVVASNNPNAAFILLHDGSGGENPFASPTNANRALLDGQSVSIAVVASGIAGRADYAVLSIESGGAGSVVSIRRSGANTTASTPRDSGGQPTAVGAGDVIAHDGIADAVVSSTAGGGVAYFLPGNSDGTFGAALNPPTDVGDRPSGVVVGDIDGDGRDDVAVVNTDTGSLSLLLSTLVPPTPTPTITNTSGPATNTPTPGPTGTPTLTPRSTPKDTATFKAGTFELSPSSCSIGSGRSGERSNGAVVFVGVVALIAMRLRGQRSK